MESPVRSCRELSVYENMLAIQHFSCRSTPADFLQPMYFQRHPITLWIYLVGQTLMDSADGGNCTSPQHTSAGIGKIGVVWTHRCLMRPVSLDCLMDARLLARRIQASTNMCNGQGDIDLSKYDSLSYDLFTADMMTRQVAVACRHVAYASMPVV